MRWKKNLLTFVSCLFFMTATMLCAAEKPNFLFIAVDDLRTELGCYGKKQIKSPNIDKLAARGIVFEKAYCMVSVCGASRASLMTGIRPKFNRFTNAFTHASEDAPQAVTLNTHFKNHGYTTLSNGKIFHHGIDNNAGWSEPAWRPGKVPPYALPESFTRAEEARKATGRKEMRGPAWEGADVSDDTFADGRILEKSLLDLRRLAEAKRPFFLAVGFLKPHLPFVAPKKYWDMYDPAAIELPENFSYVPKDVPDVAVNIYDEIRKYAGIPAEGLFPTETAKSLIHGYYACISYIDAQIGRLLDELEALGLAENTIVVLWGDHGWHLGEHTLWCKHCVFENCLNAPLLMRLPGRKEGLRISAPVEFIDIYPSLCELAGLPQPPAEQLQGKSLLPLTEKPDSVHKSYVFGRYGNGDSVFDGRYRYSEYRDKDGDGKLIGRMLYDHRTDPRENVNIAEHPENAPLVETLAGELTAIKRLP